MNLEEGTDGNAKVVVTKSGPGGEAFLNIRITRTFGEVLTTG